MDGSTADRVAARQRYRVAFLILAAIAPIVLLIGCIARYGVNVPVGDEWALVPLFEKWRGGQLTFADLYQQHNEHRILLPKLIYLAFAELTGWNLRAEMFFSVLLCVGTSAGIYALLRRTVGGGQGGLLLLCGAANLLMFSPAQAQNWLWGFQLQMFIPNLCLVATLVVLASDAAWRWKFGASVLLIMAATFSFGSGLLLWPVVALFLWMRGEGRSRIVAWLVAAAAVAALYFPGYYRVPAAQPLTGWLDYPAYFLVFLGGALTRGDEGQLLFGAIALGLVALLLYAAMALHFVRAGAVPLRDAAPWLALGVYVIGSAALAAYSRVNWGPKQAMDTRYVTSSSYLYLALIALAAIAARQFEQRGGEAMRHGRTVLITAIVSLALVAYPAGLEEMATLQREQLAGLAALQLSKVIDTTDSMRRDLRMIPGFAPDPLRSAATLERLELLRYKRRKSGVLNDDRAAAAQGASGFGAVDELQPRPPGSFEISGWAVLPRRARTAPLVVLAYRSGDRWTAFAHSDVWEFREDVVARLRERSYQQSGWRKSFDASSLPAEAVAVSAWAVDPLANRLHKLAGEHPLPRR